MPRHRAKLRPNRRVLARVRIRGRGKDRGKDRAREARLLPLRTLVVAVALAAAALGVAQVAVAAAVAALAQEEAAGQHQRLTPPKTRAVAAVAAVVASWVGSGRE